MRSDSRFQTVPLGDLVAITSGKKNSSEAVERGKYPFFTCGREVLRIDVAEHDREAVLLGGNNANAVFPVFYAKGKFTARQRVYVIWSLDSEVLDNRFLYFALDHLASSFIPAARGTTTLFITLPMLRALEVPLPSIEAQRPIADLLETLDYRARTLRDTNATLEAIAQTLFKSWFIDFDPVRAKADGREPEGMDAATAALFPAEFEESALGPIPKGWQVSTLGTICELTKGCSYKGDGLSVAEGAFMFNLGCFNAQRVFATENVKRYRGAYRPRHAVSPGDLIIANTDMTQARDILGRPALVPGGFEPGFVSHHVYKVAVLAADAKKADALRHFLFFTFREPRFRERAIGFATGTTVLALPTRAVVDCPVCLPGTRAMAIWNELVNPLFAAIQQNEKRANQLANLRNALLPRIISGQLRLPEAQADIEEFLA